MIEKIRSYFSGSNHHSPDERSLAPQLFKPQVTIGSIVLWAILKTALIMFATWFIIENYQLREYWWLSLAGIWFFAFYPAYLQYQQYKESSKVIEENSLCATCRHYDSSGLVCVLLDEHVSVNHTPCGGAGWEGKQPDL